MYAYLDSFPYNSKPLHKPSPCLTNFSIAMSPPWPCPPSPGGSPACWCNGSHLYSQVLLITGLCRQPDRLGPLRIGLLSFIESCRTLVNIVRTNSFCILHHYRLLEDSANVISRHLAKPCSTDSSTITLSWN